MREVHESRAARRAPAAVFNQTPVLVDVNLFETDPGLRDALTREGGGNGSAELTRIGAELGDAQHAEWARLANQYAPVWKSFDPRGERVDRIEFHPAWHALMRGIVANGFHASPWDEGRAHGHLLRAAGYLMQARVEQGSLCPTTMTYGAVPAMQRDPWLAREWVPRIRSREYDAADAPASDKRGLLIGMGMTEKQGGSDVRANTTRAVGTADGYRLTGHKWFFSAPQCDAHLVLAYASAADGADEGLSCFFVPRFERDGTRNAIRVQRLKDKVGNRSNASSEVEFHGAWGHRIGDPGRGVPTILEMGTYTRLDCVIGSAGMMREAVVQAIHHARHRETFGRALVDHPLMAAVLADLAIESEAATALALRLARAFDADHDDAQVFRRTMTSAAKFWVCKRGPELAAEAMEVLGGNGYVEELPLARIYREMPVNSIWEGSGNIMCLDVLRAFAKSSRAADVVIGELAAQRGKHRAFDAAFERFASRLAGPAIDEGASRAFVRALVTLEQAALLLQANEEGRAMAEGFCATRLDPEAQWGGVYGDASSSLDVRAILDRAWAAR